MTATIDDDHDHHHEETGGRTTIIYKRLGTVSHSPLHRCAMDAEDDGSDDSEQCLRELLGGISFEGVSKDAWVELPVDEDTSTQDHRGLEHQSTRIHRISEGHEHRNKPVLYSLQEHEQSPAFSRVFDKAFCISPNAVTTPPPVQVVTIPEQGNGLVATSRIRKGAIIYTECALIAAQSTSSSVRACQHCFRSLEPISTLQTEEHKQLPLPNLWPIPELTFSKNQREETYQLHIDDHGRVKCPDCESLFCSINCHKACIELLGSCCASSSLLQQLDDDTLVLATRLFSYSLKLYRSTRRLDESLLQGLCGEDTDVDALELGDFDRDSSTYSLHLLYKSFCAAYAMDPAEEEVLSLRYFHKVAAIAARNGVDFVTQSPFQVYYTSVLRSTGGRGSAQHTLIKEQVASALGSDDKTLQRGMDREVQEKVATQVAALFQLTARINHSCSPNAVIQSQMFSDAYMDLIALNDIEQGEQITISYIAWGHGVGQKSTSRRRRELQAKYLFFCNCPKCKI